MGTKDRVDRERDSHVSSLWRRRIAPDGADSWPTAADLGVAELLQAAVDWQLLRQNADWHEMIMVTEAPARSAWVPEIHGLFGTAGELVLVTAEAAMDVLLAEWEAADAATDLERAAAWRSIRFFTEGQGNNLVVFGHTVVNLAVRTLALYPDLDASLIGRGPGFERAFAPRATDRRAWLSLNESTAAELTRAALPLGPAAHALCESIVDLLNGEMGDLVNLRGEQYHRWRGEGPGLPGVSFQAPRMLDRLQAGHAVSFGGPPTPYLEGREVLEELLATVGAAMRQLAGWMPSFHLLWFAAFEEVRRGNETPAVSLTSPTV